MKSENQPTRTPGSGAEAGENPVQVKLQEIIEGKGPGPKEQDLVRPGSTSGVRASAETARFLKISELYATLQGEGIHAGLPCFFIRLAVCDIRCAWCDTPDSWTGGQWRTRQELLSSVPHHISLVQITGGEPMLQIRRLRTLFEDLHSAGKKILLETGGHRSLEKVPPYVHIVMDIKLPSSGEQSHPFENNFGYLKASDEIKFVVASEEDFLRARRWIQEHDLATRFQILISPAYGMDLKKLAQWVLDSKLTVRMQLQLHKYIWGPDATMV